MKLLYNLNLLDTCDFKLDPENRAFQYNDGFFETIFIDKGTSRFLKDHIIRMKNASEILNITLPQSFLIEDQLDELLIELVKQNGIETSARLKIKIWRKTGGLYTPTENIGETLITCQAANFDNSPILSCGIFQKVKLDYSLLTSFKGPNSLIHILAGLDKKENNWNEIILTDKNDHIAECLSSNIFWLKNGILYTPDLFTGCLDGIVRKNILAYCQANDIPTKTCFFRKDELLDTELVFTSNVAGIRPILQIEEQRFSHEHALLTQLQDALGFKL